MSQDTFDQASSDAVDGFIAAWAFELPDLDTTAKHVTGRIVRLAALFQQAFGESHATVGIDNADFGILAALRRAGPDYTLTPTELARRRMMTSGGMTAAIDRLVRRGLAERLPNPADRRGSLVRLTDAGRSVIDRAVTMQADVEQRLVAPLDDGEVAQLTGLLRRLLVAVDPHSQPIG
jgi:DNA-binding MarR family transcriptional regulator